MRITMSFASALALAALAPAIAQDTPPAPGQAQSQRGSDFQEPFVDTGNTTARELAERQGITVGAATRTLRRAHAAGQLARKFQRENPDEFAGSFVSDDAITVFLKTGPGAAEALTRARGAVDAAFAPEVRIVPVQHSLAELRGRASRLESQLGRADHLVGYRIDYRTNRLSVLSQDVERTRGHVRERLGSLPDDVAIEASQPIELTQTTNAFGGTTANSGVTSGCPTFGYVVIRQSDSALGLLTVAHASSTSMRYNGYAASALSSCSGGTSVTQRGVYQTPHNTLAGQDFAWYSSSTHNYTPHYWDGSYVQTVYGALYPAGGTPVCKFGRKTFRTCGTTTGAEVYNGGYGWMLEVRKNAGYTMMNDVGDSGGPVWSSTGTGIGIVHAKQGTEIMLVATFAAFVEHNLPIRLYCVC